MLLTVLTPVYNRANVIEKLFLSLESQTDKDFEWLIVDDGSTDEIADAVEKFKSTAHFKIEFIRKENGGKHTALNVGIPRIESELTFIVDSDDYLTDDAVQTIKEYADKYRGTAVENKLCGFAFLRKFPDGRINGKLFEEDEKTGTYIEMRINARDMQADKAEVFYTEILKQFPFPEFEGEKFLGEDVVWIRMAKKYSMVHVNRAIYTGEYLEGGLTDGRRRHNIQSPRGCVCRAKEYMCRQINFKSRVKGCLQYLVYGKFAGEKYGRLIKQSPKKFLTFLCVAPSYIIYRKWKGGV